MSPPVPVPIQSVPFLGYIFGGLSGGRMVIIQGRVQPQAKRFHANLWSSASGDLVLHVNPRLREGVLVRNTRQHGSWGPEERQTTGPMPFQRGQPFQVSRHLHLAVGLAPVVVPVPVLALDMVLDIVLVLVLVLVLLEIRLLSQAFALWVNGRHICDYSHRLPPATIDQLEVAGDVTLACVTC
ncbi:PREDICTED: galectin-5-like [Haliaeetus leucocephalus]|uniref:galectin-5-like n=1 Tax=Haliaeetus leucocephalus TaxID=52644 RepID=UPI00053CDAD5|nr:PREDICTED: galectin-5-like [Haliaeetus leucocephalus]